MLTAFIEKRHDDVNTSCLSAYCGNDTFQILKMIIRGHMIGMAAQRVGQAVVADVNQQVQVIAADGIVDDAFCFA